MVWHAVYRDAPQNLIVDGADPVEMRAFLKSGGETLTETWMFQYHPF